MNKILLIVFLVLDIYASSVTISIIKPQIGSSTVSIEANGIVIPKNKRVLTAQTTGILQLFIHNNMFVKKGERIAYIKNKRREKNLKLLKQKLSLGQIELQLQQHKLEIAKQMLIMGVGSKNIYLSQKLALEQLKEFYNNTEKNYELLKLEEKNANIIANKNAILTNLLPQNSYISYGMPLATFLTQDSVVKLFVDAQYIHQLKKGMHVKLQSTYTNTEGTISNILPISFDNLSEVIVASKTQLPQNLQVSAKIILKHYIGVFIPKEAIVLAHNAPVVYIIKDRVAHQFFIYIIKDMVNKVLIKNNLPKGAKIALKNAYMLHNNLKVLVK